MTSFLRPATALHDPVRARQADRDELSLALMDARNRTLRWLTAFEAAGRWDGGEGTGYRPWCCVGRVAWFQEYWTARHVQRGQGEAAFAALPRLPSVEPQADAWFAPERGDAPAPPGRPDPDAVRSFLSDTLELTLQLLESAVDDDAGLHVYRLVLLHEDRIAERLAEAAQWLGVDPADAAAPAGPAPARAQREPLWLPAGPVQLGSLPGGLVPPNERWRHTVQVPECEIDSQPVCWARYVEFAEDRGYDDARWWTEAGWAWVQAQGRRAPRGIEQLRGAVVAERRGSLQRLHPGKAVAHVTLHEAEAWCRWAGRRLPAEAEWERARATAASRGWVWGDVWEWMLNGARPYPGGADVQAAGFAPARSRPGWGMLRGASSWTVPRAIHPAARRYAQAQRDDLFCGFRSCAV
jgi:formylglycine-generating enzyme required for sulfatase activity